MLLSPARAQNALSFLDVVEVIVAHFNYDHWTTEAPASRKSCWESSGNLARGVNRMWKSTTDKHLIKGLKNRQRDRLYIAEPSLGSDAMPPAVLAILAGSADFPNASPCPKIIAQ